jgi:hypothetical protein
MSKTRDMEYMPSEPVQVFSPEEFRLNASELAFFERWSSKE